MPVIEQLIKGKNPKFVPWIIQEDEIENFVSWATNISGSGNMEFSYKLRTSYLNAIEPKGESSFVVAVKDSNSGEYVGMSVISKKYVFINNKKEKVAYVSDLFIEEGKRNHVIFGLFVRMLLFFTHGCKGYLSTVMYDNDKVLKVLLSGKGKMVPYKDFGTINTMVFYPHKIKSGNFDSEIKISTIEEHDINNLLNFWKEESINNQFFPHYTKQNLIKSTGLLRDLKINNIVVANKQNKIVGSIAVWDQSNIKSWVLKAYPFWIKRFRPFINLVAKIKGIPTLPPENKVLNYKMIGLLIIKNNDPKVFKSLLHFVKEKLGHEKNSTLLLMALHENSPLLESIDFPFYNIKSKLIFASKSKNEPSEKSISYIELGSL